MSPPLFLVRELPSGDRYRLDGPEGHHAATVQRLRPGEELLLGDGAGGMAFCRVLAATKGALDVEVRQRWTEPRPTPAVTVVQGLAKGDRAELAVQAMTEAGVDTIVPWSAARSVVRWKGDRGDRAVARWRAIVREATKQSRRAWQPEVTDPMSTKAVCDVVASHAAYLLHEEAEQPLTTVPLPTDRDVLLVVGPEGGIAPEEVEAFTRAGAVPVRLGREVLRTSTAGVAALAVLHTRTGRWA